VHRIGRTGRAGHNGHAISFARPDQGADVRSIERLIRTTLPISEHPEFPKERFVDHPQRPAAPGRRGFGGGGYGRRPSRPPRRSHGFRGSPHTFRSA
jgi:ATP-dependent RNA helicase RhlE